ncbi:MAG: hypothetical protein PHI37_04605 [Candidatus Gracilibacteria bacterium]|nr:hypothetical protein [Candidatus Gracilibacteria bacterium]
MKQYIDKIKEFGEFIEKNKILITSSVYGLGVAFQLIMLMSYSGFQGFFYVSLKFSIILFIIFLFLFILSVPSLFFFIFGLFLYGIVHFWGLGIIGKIFIFIYFFILFFGKPILRKFFPKKYENFRNKLNKSEFDKFTLKIISLVFILIFSVFGFNVFASKYVDIKLKDGTNIIGELYFYNQEYYFLNFCGDKVIIPSLEVIGVKLIGDEYSYLQKSNHDKLEKLNKDAVNFCNSYILNKK